MRSRWFHRPLLHSPALGLEKRPTWLELFYDLVFVAAFIQLGNGLSENVTVVGFGTFASVFVALWVAWTGFTFYENRYTLDDFAHRTVVLVQMLAVGAMALSAAGALHGDTVGLSLSTGVALLCVAVMYLRASIQLPRGRDYSRYWGWVFGLGSAAWLVAAVMPALYAHVLWAAGTLGILVSPLSRQSLALAERFPIDFHHLGERYGLLTIIVLGESFVKVITALVSEGAGVERFVQGSMVLLVTCGIWWVYFDDIAGSRIRKGRATWIVWLYAHIPLQMAITASGVALKKAVHFSWTEPAPSAYRWLLAGSLALVYASVAAVDSVTERRQAELSDRARVNARWISAVVLLVLAPAGRTMSGGLFFALVIVINVAQVVFDMMMAPLEEDAHTELGTRSMAEVVAERVRTGTGSGRPRRQLSEAVRKGTPSELRRDLYFYFMEGSWTRVFVVFAFLFLIANVFFAALYTLDPLAIEHARASSFADAFFFSVQTMSTIGYGALTPGNAYGNAVVTVEAGLTVIGMAIVTGLVFAKASRPRASVLFSKCMIITRMDGKKMLAFRAGNARGNEVVDASMTVSLLKDEVSPEGHHVRRLHDLKLRRQRSPMFILTWLALHEIDEQSPAASVDWEHPEQHLVSLVVTLIGHDGTYGQTIYARHVYYAEDIRVGHRFVDVIHELEDGRVMIDYTHFHDTIPDDEVARASAPPGAGREDA